MISSAAVSCSAPATSLALSIAAWTVFDLIVAELEGLDLRGGRAARLLPRRAGQMVLHQPYDFSLGVVRRHLDQVVGVPRIQDPRNGAQLGPPDLFDLVPLDAGLNDGVVGLDQGPRRAALDGGVPLEPLVQGGERVEPLILLNG